VDMRLARNEFVYFTGIVQQAIDDKSKTIFLLDPRIDGPHMWKPHDEHGRWVPPYEIGCFASYCVERGVLTRVAAAQLGLPYDAFNVLWARADAPVPGLTCEMLTAAVPSYPPNASAISVELIDQYRSQAPLTCVTVSMAWHDLGVDLSR
jgi:hypothetical protein